MYVHCGFLNHSTKANETYMANCKKGPCGLKFASIKNIFISFHGYSGNCDATGSVMISLFQNVIYNPAQ